VNSALKIDVIISSWIHVLSHEKQFNRATNSWKYFLKGQITSVSALSFFLYGYAKIWKTLEHYLPCKE